MRLALGFAWSQGTEAGSGSVSTQSRRAQCATAPTLVLEESRIAQQLVFIATDNGKRQESPLKSESHV